MLDHREAIQQVIAAASSDMTRLFDRAAGKFDGLVVAGASGLVAEHTLAGLRRLNLLPLAIVDNNERTWGVRADGIKVVPPAEAIRLHPDAVYVAAIFTHTPLRRQLQQLGASKVVPYATLFHRFPSCFLPFFAVDNPQVIADQEEDIRRAADIWGDEESAILYRTILNWFVTLSSDEVPIPFPASSTYFPDELNLRRDEVFVDCGAFDGDTLQAYLQKSGREYGRIIAIEPDPETFRRLLLRVGTFERTVTVNAAVGARPGRLSFVASGGLSSHAQYAGAQGISDSGSVIDVDVVRLDDLAPRPTYVKMDIEGFERDALAGAQRLLSGGQTAFAVTLYHRMTDLWQLPLYIHESAPDLRLYLRHYAEDWAETVCYAIPPGRAQASLK